MSHYQHLSIEERESICGKTNVKGESVRRIAAELGRSASTISRGIEAESMQARIPSIGCAKTASSPEKAMSQAPALSPWPLRATAVRLLTQQQWSPEQISERMAMEHGKRLGSVTAPFIAP
ncbi:MAG: helix-turn-helix domain-containing protein [Acutalibacteraceae bacterium]